MSSVAAIQMASGPNIGANLIEAGRLIQKAAEAGAILVVLPENFAIMGMQESDKVHIGESFGSGTLQSFLAEQAAKWDIWLVGGTIPLACDDSRRIRAASLVFDDTGKCVARYDKIHLFDVHIEETGENYVESETIQPGDEVLVLDSPVGRLGVAVCYDLRFPEQFRAMLDKGVEVIALPSAFTAITGKAHWESLVRARAIENLSYVIAAAQGGYHINGRETWGHSMIVDPWGAVLDVLPSGSGFVQAEVDAGRVAATRRNFPAITHRRLNV